MIVLHSENGKPITEADVRDWQRKRDSKKDDFPFIHLSKQQEQLLRKCKLDYVKKEDGNKSDAIHLRDLDFIYINRTDSSERENIEFCEIRERGINYLAYLNGEREKEKRQFSHNWKVAMFSAFSGALLARPLWAGIDWFISAVKFFIDHLPVQ